MRVIILLFHKKSYSHSLSVSISAAMVKMAHGAKNNIHSRFSSRSISHFSRKLYIFFREKRANDFWRLDYTQ